MIYKSGYSDDLKRRIIDHIKVEMKVDMLSWDDSVSIFTVFSIISSVACSLEQILS